METLLQHYIASWVAGLLLTIIKQKYKLSITDYSVRVMCAELLFFVGKMAADGLRWRPFLPHKAVPHTSLSHYNTKYQITRNIRIMVNKITCQSTNKSQILLNTKQSPSSVPPSPRPPPPPPLSSHPVPHTVIVCLSLRANLCINKTLGLLPKS